DVAGAALGPDQRLLRVLDLDLSAQAPYLDIDCAIVNHVVVQTLLAQQLVATKDSLRRREEDDKQVELTVGERDRRALRRLKPAQPNVELPARESVSADARQAVRHCFLAVRSAEQCPDACE